MNTRTILIASFAVLAMSAGVPSIAAAPAQSQSDGAGMMRQGEDSGQGRLMMRSDGPESMMGNGMMSGGMMNMHGGMKNNHGMHGGGMMGMMGGGMMGMMDSCPMVMGTGLDRKTAMRMHGEMMRAIGDILIKYADKMEPAAKQ